ncbi:MAG: hypothetical protein H6722_15800 [Sandaracinus sp.]|nr:hypothetical protein [Sandaracinus sp.]
MSRRLPALEARSHGRHVRAAEPFVFHCNHYNHWLQSTLLLSETLPMRSMIVDAAEEVAFHALQAGAEELGLVGNREAIAEMAAAIFSEHGFGAVDLSGLTDRGGSARFSASHYGQCLVFPAGGKFAQPQSLFDRGFVAAAGAVMHGLPAGSFSSEHRACFSVGDDHGEVALERDATPRTIATSCGEGRSSDASAQPPGPYADTSVDEGAILSALAGLSFSGNEEGLVPRFGVMLTHHFANFYDRISYEMVRRMTERGLREPAELLLLDAGRRCGFHTFGGIMSSAEWDAVVAPQLKSKLDWVHGMVAVVNALGWGVWRVAEVDERRIVVRIWDDYESRGHLGTYGQADGPVCYLAQGGAESIMNLVFEGDIASRPKLDDALYDEVIDGDGAFRAVQTRCMAAGDPYTEIVAER